MSYFGEKLRALADVGDERSMANWFRRRRSKQLSALLQRFEGPISVIDLGGTENFWRQNGLLTIDGLSLTLVNQTTEGSTASNVTSIVGDAADLSRFADNSFDLVISNSTIEHVGDFDRQRSMAREISRLAPAHYVQTPCRATPLEPHFLFPFFGLLPERLRVFLVQHFALGWMPRARDRSQALTVVREVRLLNRRELREIFTRSHLTVERVLGLPKSYIIVRFDQTTSVPLGT